MSCVAVWRAECALAKLTWHMCRRLFAGQAPYSTGPFGRLQKAAAASGNEVDLQDLQLKAIQSSKHFDAKRKASAETSAAALTGEQAMSSDYMGECC